jgi:uncharacterized membrane protein
MREDDFLAFCRKVDQLNASIRASSAVRQSSRAIIDGTRQTAQEWFRVVRTGLLSVGIFEDEMSSIDQLMQDLLRLAQVRSTTASYLALLRKVKKELAVVEVRRELALTITSTSSTSVEVRPGEDRVIQMLNELVPSAALSYRQAIRDLSQTDRESFRGTANEFRSVVWDALDRLASDDAVSESPGFKLEKGQSKPTQKQKTRYILSSRLGEKARRTPETSVQLIEEHVGSLARAIYDRTSISTHIATTRAETMQLRMYVETLLAELLEIHFD